MKRIRWWAISIGAVATAAMCSAAFGQAVQLPTFQFFTVQTTVSVPDRGAAYLGGVSRAASGRASRGVPFLGKAPGLGRLGRNDAFGSTISTSGASLSATVIDHREWDKAVLAEAAKRREGRITPSEVEAPRVRVALETAPVESVAEIRRQNAARDDEQRRELQALIDKARQAEAAGKPGVAKVYYDMAARRADPALREQITAHTARLAGSAPK
jgi:type II secretory pathway component GspD/PulD (secretin)